MPITPLHFGAALPFELALRDRFSTVAFVLANAVMDIQPVLALGFGVPVDVHGWTHSLPGASLIAVALTLLGGRLPRRAPYAAGFFAGALSHVALDSLMHHDLSPLWPWREGNPVIARLDVDISLVMLAPTALWWVLTLWRIHRQQEMHPERGWREQFLAM